VSAAVLTCDMGTGSARITSMPRFLAFYALALHRRWLQFYSLETDKLGCVAGRMSRGARCADIDETKHTFVIGGRIWYSRTTVNTQPGE
jgi:hypothetical protein